MRDKRPNVDVSFEDIERIRKEVADRVEKGIPKSELEKIMAPAKVCSRISYHHQLHSSCYR